MSWGNWQLKPGNRTLYIEHEGDFLYEIDLDRCRNSVEVLDWIFQVLKKTWATCDDIYDLLIAIEDIIDPQGQLCSFGKSNAIDPKKNMENYMKSDPDRFKKMVESLTIGKRKE